MSSPSRESSAPSSSRYPPSSSSSRGGGDNGGSPDRRYPNSGGNGGGGYNNPNYGKDRGGGSNNSNNKSGGNYNNGGPPYPYPPHAYGYPGSYGGYPPPPYGYAGAYGGYPPPPPYGYPGYYPPASNTSKQMPGPPQPSPPRSARSPEKSGISTPSKKNSSASANASPSATKGTFSPKDKSPAKDPTPEPQDEDLEVDPMRCDFHFYAMEHKDKYYDLAKKTVHSIVGKEDLFLTMTHLNEQLKEAWEIETAATKATYMSKEEQDRKRFMMEDEIASRHCATLTARAKSPKTPKSKEEDPLSKKMKLEEEAPSNPTKRQTSSDTPIESV